MILVKYFISMFYAHLGYDCEWHTMGIYNNMVFI